MKFDLLNAIDQPDGSVTLDINLDEDALKFFAKIGIQHVIRQHALNVLAKETTQEVVDEDGPDYENCYVKDDE